MKHHRQGDTTKETRMDATRARIQLYFAPGIVGCVCNLAVASLDDTTGVVIYTQHHVLAAAVAGCALINARKMMMITDMTDMVLGKKPIPCTKRCRQSSPKQTFAQSLRTSSSYSHDTITQSRHTRLTVTILHMSRSLHIQTLLIASLQTLPYTSIRPTWSPTLSDRTTH